MRRLLFALLPMALYFPLFADEIINTEDFNTGKIMLMEIEQKETHSSKAIRTLQHEENKLLRIEKRVSKMKLHLSQSNQQVIGGIADSTDRWFWLWILGWGTGLLLTVLSGGAIVSAFLGIVWILGFGVGSASLILWLLKRFQ